MFLLASVLVALGAEASSPIQADIIEVYCPTGEDCPADDLDADPFVLTGFRQTTNPAVYWYWPGQIPCSAPCPVGGNAQGVPNLAIQAGIEEWSIVPSPWETDYELKPFAPESSVCGGLFPGLEHLLKGYDGLNTVMWAPLGGGTIGLACWSGVGECDIILDNSWPGAAVAENTRTVLLHEVGHCQGLGHTDVAGAVMYPSMSGPNHLQADDVAGYCAIYGCAGGASPTPPPPTSTATPTPTPVLFYCGERVWVVPVVCRWVPAISRD